MAQRLRIPIWELYLILAVIGFALGFLIVYLQNRPDLEAESIQELPAPSLEIQ